MTWGSPDDVKQLDQLFDMMATFSTRNDTPTFLGEFAAAPKKEAASPVRWMTAVMNGANARKMVPAIWDTGEEVSRFSPYSPSAVLVQVLQNLRPVRAD